MMQTAAGDRWRNHSGFTVLSMSLSLVAVFLPLLLMGGLPGRLLREFAVTLSVAIGISLLVSLTLTPMMCGWMLKASKPREQKRLRGFGRMLVALQQGYGKSLKWVLNHTRLVGVVLLGTIALNIWLYISIPKTFFPEQDTGVLMGGIQADQSISFQAMRGKLQDFMKIIRDDPAVDNVTGFTGGSRVNSGMMFITLKPRDERSETAQQIIDRLRVKLAKEPGANLFLMAVQDIRVGGRQSNASYQYTLLSDDLAALREWEPKIRKKLATLPELADVNSDQQDNGAEMNLVYDRDTMARLGIDVQAANSLLNNAFGQRQISTISQQFNLVNRLSVLENVLIGALGSTPFWRTCFSWFTREQKQRALQALTRVGMVHFAHPTIQRRQRRHSSRGLLHSCGYTMQRFACRIR